LIKFISDQFSIAIGLLVGLISINPILGKRLKHECFQIFLICTGLWPFVLFIEALLGTSSSFDNYRPEAK
jgi:hypothetical protein